MNGDNTFIVDLDGIQRVTRSRATEAGGAFDIVGYPGASKDGPRILASFGSDKAAGNAYASLVKAHSGVTVRAGGLAKVGKVASVALALFGATIAVGLVTASGNSTNVAAAAAVPPMFIPQQPAPSAAVRVVEAGGFNKNETSLDDLVAGKYEFRPQIQVPQVAAPTLNCPKH